MRTEWLLITVRDRKVFVVWEEFDWDDWQNLLFQIVSWWKQIVLSSGEETFSKSRCYLMLPCFSSYFCSHFKEKIRHLFFLFFSSIRSEVNGICFPHFVVLSCSDQTPSAALALFYLRKEEEKEKEKKRKSNYILNRRTNYIDVFFFVGET